MNKLVLKGVSVGDFFTDMYDKNYEITGRISGETQRAIEEGAEKIEFCYNEVEIKEIVRLLNNGYKIKSNGETIYFTR